MSTITCTFEEFKRMAKEFHEAAPTLNEDELEGAWAAMGIGYLGMREEMWNTSAAILYEMEARTYWNRMIEIMSAVYPIETAPIHLPSTEYSHD